MHSSLTDCTAFRKSMQIRAALRRSQALHTSCCLSTSGIQRRTSYRGREAHVLFCLHLETRRVSVAGITRHPTEEWMAQMARNAIDETSGRPRQHRDVIRPRHARTSTVKKSTPATTVICAAMKSLHVVVSLRFGAGRIPCRRRMLPTV